MSATPETERKLLPGWNCETNTYFVPARFCREMEAARDEAIDMVKRLFYCASAEVTPQERYDALQAALVAMNKWKEGK